MKEEIKTTSIWQLYEKGKNFNRKRNIYSDTDRNFRMYNGNQWDGLKSGTIEPITLNIIKPIVKYKVGTINANLKSINFSSNNFSTPEFQKEAKTVCDLLNRYAAKVYEKDNMDMKIRRISNQAGINSEGIIYVNFVDGDPVNEVINKVDVYYGNENSEEIQTQPYIIIKSRKPVSEIREIGRSYNIPEEDLMSIVGDNDTSEQSGLLSRDEVDDMAVLLTKFWKEKGTIYYSKSTMTVDFIEDEDSGLSLYPLEHFVWESEEGSSRGAGEVKNNIANQIEINKTATRRALAVSQNAYPKPVVNTDLISNYKDIMKIGVPLYTKGVGIDDVRKLVNYTIPATMSGDSQKLQEELITYTKELAGAGDIADGTVNPEAASGKAILAVQQASQQPLTEQTERLNATLEGIARIWLDGWIVYSPDGKEFIDEVSQINPETQETELIEVLKTISQDVLKELKASVKVDITPTGAFDRYAVELSLENLFMQGKITFEEYVKALPDNSVMPKIALKMILDDRKKAIKEIAKIRKEAAIMQGQYDQAINDKENKMDQSIADAQAQTQMMGTAEQMQSSQEMQQV